MCEMRLAYCLSHAWVHLVTAQVNLSTDHKMSGRPTLAKYKHFNTICEHTSDNSTTDSNSSCLNWWTSKHGLETLCNCLTFLFANSQYVPRTSWRGCTISWDHAPIQVIFHLLLQKYVIQTSSCVVWQWFHLVCSHVEYIPSRHDRRMT